MIEIRRLSATAQDWKTVLVRSYCERYKIMLLNLPAAHTGVKHILVFN
jgi:hypothetical protein